VAHATVARPEDHHRPLRRQCPHPLRRHCWSDCLVASCLSLLIDRSMDDLSSLHLASCCLLEFYECDN
jgi:hypothetical protein